MAYTLAQYAAHEGENENSSNSTNDERIGKVAFGTISNSSTGTAGYENFTALSTNVTRGAATSITITPTWTGTKYNEGYAVFIDYNQDGDFADAGETVWTKTASKTTPVSGSFTIPASATLGATRMRVSMKYNGIPTACETFSYGQVEDYTINIVSAARETESVSQELRISLYPNPVKDELNIELNGQADLGITIFDLSGKIVLNNQNNRQGQVRIDLSKLMPGAYVMQILGSSGLHTDKLIKI